VVAQLIKATPPDCYAAVPGSVPAPPQSYEGWQESWLCMINKSRDVMRPFASKKKIYIYIYIPRAKRQRPLPNILGSVAGTTGYDG
jgi:hypothetical protein